MFGPLAVAAASAATVSVNGGEGCLSAAAVQVELDDVDGLLGNDRILIDLVRRNEPWTLFVRVVRRDVEVFGRSLSVTRPDCPLLPAALARTLERGVEGVPRWPFNDRQRWVLGITTATTWPYLDWSGAVTWGRAPRPRGTWSWEVDAGAFTRTVQPVGRGRVSLSGAMIGFGPIAEARLTTARVGIKPRVAIGFGRATPTGLPDPDPSEVRPRATLGLEGLVRLPRGLRVGLRFSMVAIRSSFTSEGPPGWQATAPEPRFRLGLVLGFRGAVGK